MCTGLEILAAASIGTAAAGQVITGFEKSSAAGIRGNIARSNQEIAEKTAEVQRLGAETATEKAAFEEARLRAEVERTLGQAKTYFASRNLDPAFGSPLLIQGLTEAQGEVDAGIIRAGGRVERAGRLAEAASTEAGAASSAWEAAAAEQEKTLSLLSGVFGAGSTLLSGVSKWPGLQLGGSSGMIGPTDIRPAWARL